MSVSVKTKTDNGKCLCEDKDRPCADFQTEATANRQTKRNTPKGKIIRAVLSYAVGEVMIT